MNLIFQIAFVWKTHTIPQAYCKIWAAVVEKKAWSDRQDSFTSIPRILCWIIYLFFLLFLTIFQWESNFHDAYNDLFLNKASVWVRCTCLEFCVCSHSSRLISALQMCKFLINNATITSITQKLLHCHKPDRDALTREKLCQEWGGSFNKSKS